MTKEFENLLELFNSNNSENYNLAFNIAQNYKKEFKEYFGYSPKMYELICNNGNKWANDVNNYGTYIVPKYFIKITLQKFVCNFLQNDLYDKRFSEELQCSGWKQLKRQVEQKVKKKDLDLTNIHYILRPHIKKYWYFISKLNIENNK